MLVRISRFAACRALLCIAIAAGCADGLTGPGASELEDAERLWKSRNISSYRITQRVECFCDTSSTHRYEITVVAGVITSAVDAVSREPVSPARLQSLKTVPQLFEYARSNVRSRTLGDAEYDPQNGMPTYILRDPVRTAIDDELRLRSVFLGQ